MRHASPLPLVLATLVALVWVGGAGWFLLGATQPGDVNALLVALAVITAPAALPFAIAGALRPGYLPPEENGASGAADAEAYLAGISARIGALGGYLEEAVAALREGGAHLAGEAQGLKEAADSIRASTDGASAAAAGLGETLGRTEAQIGTFAHTLSGATGSATEAADTLARTVASLDEALQGATRHGQEADAHFLATLASLNDSSRDHLALFQEASARIGTTTEGALARAKATLGEIETSVARQAEALSGLLDTARTRLAGTGKDAEEALSARLAALGAMADALDQRLNAQSDAVAALGTAAERTLKLLDARLQHSEETGSAALTRLQGRIDGTAQGLAAISPTLRQEETAVTALQQAVAALEERAGQALRGFEEALPGQVARSEEAASAIEAHLGRVGAAAGDVGQRMEALQEPVEAGRMALVRAGEAVDARREALASAGEALKVELEQARQILEQIEAEARDQALTAATGLVDTLTRANDVTAQAAAKMRTALDAVVADAKDALGAAAADALSGAFVAPIDAKIDEATRHASGAAERTASSMAALAATLKLLDGKATDQLRAMEDAEQKHLLAASSLLGQELKRRADALADELAPGEPESAGDGIFKRLLKRVRGLGPGEGAPGDGARPLSPLAARLAADAALKDRAADYRAGFDALLARVAGHHLLASALEQSDEGRLASLLGEALAETDRETGS